jgi:hypothetical protein
MNSTQKFYDLGFLTVNNSIQKINPFDYLKNLRLIQERKTQFPTFDKFIMKKMREIPYKNHFVMESNKKYHHKIKEMRDKPVAPKINTVFIELDQRIKNYKEINKINKSRALTLDNRNYKKRIKNQQPKLLKAECLSKLFINNHDKYLEIMLRNSKFKKKVNKPSIRNKNSIIKLPNISSYREAVFKKFHSRTEYNLDSEENSKDNSIEQKDHKYIEISHQRQGHIDNKDENNN